MSGFLRTLIFLTATLIAAPGFTAATIEAATGEVKVGASVATAVPVRTGDRVASTSYVVTGPKSRMTLRFPDGQSLALHENTELRITEYVFAKDAPARDRSSLELLKGAMRFVSGALAQRSPNAVVVRTRLATAGVRGTDFMLALVNPLYFQILKGQISVVNSAGTPVFGPGAIGTVAADGAVALTVPLNALPPGIVQAFNQLSLVNLAGLTPALSPATPGLLPAGAGVLAIPGAILIGIAAALAGDDAQNATATATATGTGTR